ncbi:MAG: glycoside hydrolase domain-containing protein [Dermatophilaceae bacterium]
MDEQILASQQSLNTTYASAPGWVSVPESGTTGWDTIYGLRRGLQWELGISPVSSGFGPATTSAFQSQIGRIDASSATKANILRILSGALWCKGYPGFYEGSPVEFASLEPYVGRVRDDLGLGSGTPFVDVKLMTSLLSMDAYTVPFFGGGSEDVREVQQWMNGTYASRRDFALVPCDGIFSRQVQTALLFALQYEFGMADGVANGNFGPGTRDGLRAQATVGPGSTDGSKHFVRLYQASMRFNRRDVPFSGTFDGTTGSETSSFQSFMEIPQTGRGDYTTWCNLLVSNGDTTIATEGFDTNRQLTTAMAAGARANGYTHAGRYTVGAGKFITSPELDALKAAGLKLFPLHQRFNNSAAVMTRDAGRTQGLEAIERCRTLGLPPGSLVFFNCDFDPVGETIHGPVLDFFEGVGEVMGSVLNGSYDVGVYGTRNVCQVILDEGKAQGAFVAGMSTGWSGNMGFPMPSEWHYNQIVEVTENLGGTSVGVDHDVVSSRARAVDLSGVVGPPVERDGSTTATGFDVVFEWVCRAEVACERAIKEADSLLYPIKQWVVAVPDYILHHLRIPEYWGGNDSGLWGTYTPQIHPDDKEEGASAVSLAALAAMSPTKPASNRDVAHWAATMLGYRTWGVLTTHDDYGLEDLGGWPLDLLQAWGVYDALTTKPDLDTWMTGNLGAGDASGFGYKDVVADADAWLMAKALRDSGGGTLSSTSRGLLRMTPAQRIGTFYADRFGSSGANIGTAFAKLVDGIDAGGVNFPITISRLRDASNASTMPTEAQARTCGQALGQVLGRLAG